MPNETKLIDDTEVMENQEFGNQENLPEIINEIINI